MPLAPIAVSRSASTRKAATLVSARKVLCQAQVDCFALVSACIVVCEWVVNNVWCVPVFVSRVLCG